ncbi:MAG: nucleotide exchange factor GrpE [Caldicoprobacterales bacterium]|nr:nucleotide exchange factor GrpE [Clostridiales bacterium]
MSENRVNEEFFADKQESSREPDNITDSMECCCSMEEECEQQCGCEKDSESEIERLKEKLKESEEKREEYLKMAQRLQADFENYKRRNRNTIAETWQKASAEVVEAFLPVLDNLDRAIDSIAEAGADESIQQGIELVRRQFLDTLEKLGVEEIEALGKSFDPNLHNAVGQVEAKEGQEENTVVMVHQKGYKMGDHVIRYSMVHVAR